MRKILLGMEVDQAANLGMTQSTPILFEEECECATQVELRYLTVPFMHDDRVVLDVIAGLLNGRAGRLQRNIVETESGAASAAAGGTVVDLSDADRAAWAASMPNIALEWAAGIDAEGGPGSDMLTAYVGKLRGAGQVPVRDWAAELTN